MGSMEVIKCQWRVLGSGIFEEGLFSARVTDGTLGSRAGTCFSVFSVLFFAFAFRLSICQTGFWPRTVFVGRSPLVGPAPGLFTGSGAPS